VSEEMEAKKLGLLLFLALAGCKREGREEFCS